MTPGVLRRSGHDTRVWHDGALQTLDRETRVSVSPRRARRAHRFRVSSAPARAARPRRSGWATTTDRPRPSCWRRGCRDPSSSTWNTLAKREYLLVGSRRAASTPRPHLRGQRCHSRGKCGIRFRTEYPDWPVRLAGSFTSSTAADGRRVTATLNPTAPSQRPTSSCRRLHVYGSTGLRTFYRTNYTRAIRPFVAVAFTNTVTGAAMGDTRRSGNVVVPDR